MAHKSVWDVPKEVIVDSLLSKFFERLFAYHLDSERDEGKDEEAKRRQEAIRSKIRDLAWHAEKHPEEFNITVASVNTLVDIVATRAPILPRWLRAGIDEVLGQMPRTIVNVLKQKKFQDSIPAGYEPTSKSPQEALLALIPMFEADLSWIKDFIDKNWIHLRAILHRLDEFCEQGVEGLCNVTEATIFQDVRTLTTRLRAGLDRREAERRARGGA